MNPNPTRREFVRQSGLHLGGIALASLLFDELATSTRPVAADTPGDAGAPRASSDLDAVEPIPVRAKRIIYLFMHGGPSHVDLFDPKPDLARLAGQPLPDSLGMVMTRRKVASNPLLGPVRPFHPRGQSGLPISEFLPELASVADDLCVIRSCHGDSVNHPQSVYQMNTGSILTGRPSLGSWISYGLGTENQNLPAFVVLPDPGGGVKGGPPAWGSGYLPATHQGTLMRPGRPPILNLDPPAGISREQQRNTLDFVQSLNRAHQSPRQDDELAARIAAYELAYRMQAAAPDLVDFSKETPQTLRLYGMDAEPTKDIGTRCLLARRLVERGVRFVQVYCGNTVGWDAHENIEENHGKQCGRSDLPVTGLIKDLKQRGLWQDTLVIWGGEFGRMPMSEQGKGRDHNPWGYSVWLAGGGVKGGMAYGETDEVGLRAAVNKVHVHDLHATILYLLGIDHERLTFLHNGRDERLTDTAGRVVHEIMS